MNCFNRYGRCVVEPSDTLKEVRGKNWCAIYLYNLSDGWLFGYDIYIGDIVSARRPLSGDTLFKTELDAKYAARQAIFTEVNTSRKAKKIFSDFTLTNYEQLELF